MKILLISLVCAAICLAEEPESSTSTATTEAPDSTTSTEPTTSTTTSPATTVYNPAFGLNVILPLVTTTLGAAVLLDH